MPKKIGKEYEWKVAVATAYLLAAMIQDYDWADEILHARIGRSWLVPEIGSQVKTLALGDQAWSTVLVDWAKWREQGLTEHRNWWPDVYRKACEHWGIEPEPALLAYAQYLRSNQGRSQAGCGLKVRKTVKLFDRRT